MSTTPEKNQGVAYTNNFSKSDKSPSHRGEINIRGEIFKVSIWTGKTKNGNEYISMRLQDPVEADLAQLEALKAKYENKPEAERISHNDDHRQEKEA